MEKLSALVVEDETAIRTDAAGALSDAGFRVIVADDTDAALRALNADAEHIDAVVTNVDMPGPVNGLSLARRIDARWPWIRLLMTSARSRPRAAEMPPGFGFLRKPYDLKNMTVRVRQLIFQPKHSASG